MSDVYVVRNQLGHYWGKSKDWVDGREPRAVMRARHEDEAINTLFELGSKDFSLRGEVVSVPLSDRDEPVIEPSEHLIEKPVPEETNEETTKKTLEETLAHSGEESAEQTPGETAGEQAARVETT